MYLYAHARAHTPTHTPTLSETLSQAVCAHQTDITLTLTAQQKRERPPPLIYKGEERKSSNLRSAQPMARQGTCDKILNNGGSNVMIQCEFFFFFYFF